MSNRPRRNHSNSSEFRHHDSNRDQSVSADQSKATSDSTAIIRRYASGRAPVGNEVAWTRFNPQNFSKKNLKKTFLAQRQYLLR